MAEKRVKQLGERGQVLIMMAMGMMVFVGFVALTIDVGFTYEHRRSLQNAADAAALAGAAELPFDPALAEQKARSWAAAGGITSADQLVVQVLSTKVANDTIKVTVARDVRYRFGTVLGLISTNVPASASARVGSPAGVNRFIPLAVQKSTFLGLKPGDAATLKYDSQDATHGNSLALAFPGSSGANDFRNNIYYGSTQTLCSQGQEYDGCSSSTPTEPGGMTGPTRQAIDDMLRDTSTSCDTYGEVFKTDASNPSIITINPACDPFPPHNVTTSKRIVIIPVIDQLCSGRCDVHIVRFALFFLGGVHCNGGQGTCDVSGQYAQASLDPGAFYLGAYDGNAGMKFARLVQ